MDDYRVNNFVKNMNISKLSSNNMNPINVKHWMPLNHYKYKITCITVNYTSVKGKINALPKIHGLLYYPEVGKSVYSSHYSQSLYFIVGWEPLTWN